MPRFEHVQLDLITTKVIDKWLMDFDSVQSGFPLSASNQDKTLNGLRITILEAQYQGYLTDNPAARVKPFDSFVGHKREPFSMAEIAKLFPLELNAALKIWQTTEWYAYFLMEWTCGLRPEEAGGFMLKDWMKEYHGAVICGRVENYTHALKEGLKTSERGMTVKPVVFPDHLEKILAILEKDHAPDELLLQSTSGGPIVTETANKPFKASVRRAGVELKDRTQCSLRHTYYTELLKVFPRET